MQKNYFLPLFSFLLLTSCSSSVAVQNNTTVKGKKIGIGKFTMLPENKKNKPSTDTVCVCVGQRIGNALIPYLQEAGFTVVMLPLPDKTNHFQTMMVADSMHVDYILSGAGTVSIQGNNTYVHELTAKAITESGEVILSGSFSGAGVGAVKAAGRIGKKWVQKMK